MTGTEGANQDKDRQPSPFVEELAGRQRDIAMNGAEPWNAPVEKRRAERRRDMALLRLASMESAIHITEYIAGRLPPWKRDALEKIDNPVAALANLNRAIIQITLAEDRFDETCEERAERVKAEAEAKIRAEREAETARAYTEAQIRKAENKRQVQTTVRAITLSSLNLAYRDREKLLADLFAELELADAYDGDPVETAVEVCVRLGIGLKDMNKDKTVPAWLLERRTALTTLVRAHLQALRGPHRLDEGDEPAAGDTVTPFARPAQAQGPPN